MRLSTTAPTPRDVSTASKRSGCATRGVCGICASRLASLQNCARESGAICTVDQRLYVIHSSPCARRAASFCDGLHGESAAPECWGQARGGRSTRQHEPRIFGIAARSSPWMILKIHRGEFPGLRSEEHTSELQVTL